MGDRRHMKLTVSKFAQLADTTVRTLRHYRQLGILVPSEKNENQQNVYTTQELKTFHNIKLMQSLGLSLKEIKEWFEAPEYSFEKMIDVQEKVLVRKRDTIEYSLEMIERIKTIKEKDQSTDLNPEMLMLLMSSMLLEDIQRDIFKEYYSNDIVDKIFPKDKSKQKEIDRLTLNLLTIMNQALINDYSPEDEFVQEQLNELMPDSYLQEWKVDDEQANEELYERLQPYTSLLPDHMISFLTEAFDVLLDNNRDSNQK